MVMPVVLHEISWDYTQKSLLVPKLCVFPTEIRLPCPAPIWTCNTAWGGASGRPVLNRGPSGWTKTEQVLSMSAAEKSGHTAGMSAVGRSETYPATHPLHLRSAGGAISAAKVASLWQRRAQL